MEFRNEKFDDLKKQHLCQGVLFTDDVFKCTTDGIKCLSGDCPINPEFKRPNAICNDPVLKHVSQPGSLCLGNITNINTVLGMSILNERADLWEAVFPNFKTQGFSNGYAGIFRVRFWIDGALTDVVVDDILPTIADKVVCVHSTNKNEFWPSILVKAYAKLLGGYEYLENVRLEDVLLNLTGCLLNIIPFDNLSTARDILRVHTFETLKQSLEEGALILLCTKPTFSKPDGIQNESTDDSSENINSFTDWCKPHSLGTLDPINGLCSNYAYLLTKTSILLKDPSIWGSFVSLMKRSADCAYRERLLRLRSTLTLSNKATNFGQWRGAYSDLSEEWEGLSEADRSRAGLTFSSEFEFYMPLSEVLNYFTVAIVCQIVKTNLFGPCRMSDCHGEWHGVRSGGGLNFRQTFLDNPQYAFELKNDRLHSLLVSLTRKYNWDREANVIIPDTSPPAIGLALLQVEANRNVRAHVLSHCKLIDVHTPRTHRAIFSRYSLERGRYVLIQFLEEPKEESAYLLRAYMPTYIQELTIDYPIPGLFSFISGKPVKATRIEIRRANNLTWLNPKMPPSVYCRLRCEGSSVFTSTKKNNSNPIWNEVFIFFRCNPAKQPIVIDLWDKRVISADGFLGEHVVKKSDDNGDFDVDIFEKPARGNAGARMKGILNISLFSVQQEDFMNI